MTMTPHGGKREGSGRKPGKGWDGKGEYTPKFQVQKHIRLTQKNADWLKRSAKEVSQNQMINDVLGEYQELIDILIPAWLGNVDKLLEGFNRLYDPSTDAAPERTSEALRFIKVGIENIREVIERN